MDAKVRVHGHFNGLKTTLLFALMWAIIMLIWWATGGSRQTLSIYIVIGLITTFGTYWFSDKLAIASMGAREVSEQEAPEIYQIVRELSAKAGKPMPRIYIAPTMSPTPSPPGATNGTRPSAVPKASCRFSTPVNCVVCWATNLCTCTTTTS